MNKINFKLVTKKINVKEFFQNETRKCLVIYSIKSVEKNDINLDNENFVCFSTKEIGKNKDKIDEMFKELDSYEKIISIGGGTATDIGKYLSFKFNVDLISIPTMLSTNAYSTNKVALVVDDKVVSLDSVMPNEVYFDDSILKKSIKYNLYGLVDIFSIYTALNDWDLAVLNNNEKKSLEYDEARKILDTIQDYVSSADLNSIKENIEFIYEKVGESGFVTNKYGSGKPESGSEHIFAKALEKEIAIPHAISVANGIVLMMLAQKYILNDKELYEKGLAVVSALKKLDIYKLNDEYNIDFKLIERVFNNLKPRADRYSVVDLIYNDENIKNKILEDYKKILNIKLED